MNVVATSACFVSCLLFADPPTTQPSEKLIDSKTWGQYTIRVYSELSPDSEDCVLCEYLGGTVRIIRGGRIVYELGCMGRCFIGHINEEDKKHTLIPPGRDITGNGRPNLVISDWTGGNHCCVQVEVLELGKDRQWRLLAAIGMEGADGYSFEDLDGDANLEFVTSDFTYGGLEEVYRIGIPEIILRYRDGDYRLAYDLMARPAPRPAVLRKLALQIRHAKGWRTTELRDGDIRFRKGKNPHPGDSPCADHFHRSMGDESPYPVLWEKMLSLVYTGHLDLLDKFLNMAWPKDVPGKQAFSKDFRKRLKESPYWADIVAWPKKP